VVGDSGAIFILPSAPQQKALTCTLKDSLPQKFGTVVPIVVGSDGTQLTDFSGGKKAWPVYMTIGNIASAVRDKPSNCAIVLLALLPVGDIDPTLIHEILLEIFGPISKGGNTGMKMYCADKLTRLAYLRPAGWVADFMEYMFLFRIYQNSCPVCDVSEKRFGDHDPQSEFRDYAAYKAAYHAKTLVEKISRVHAPPSFLWDLEYFNPVTLWKPDLLHVMYLGLFKHLMSWITCLLKKHKRLDKFDAAWKSVESYPGIHAPRRAYSSVKQWQGKEMRSFARIILPCLGIALMGSEIPAERAIFARVLRCTAHLSDFSLMLNYRSHDPSTIAETEGYWEAFHEELDAFLPYRAGSNAKQAAVDAMRELREAAKKNAGRQTAAQRKRNTTKLQKDLATLQTEVLEAETHFNFPKAHLPRHFPWVIPQFGHLPAWSSETTEAAHKEIKAGYRLSNHGDSFQLQLIEHCHRQRGFALRQLNLVGWAKDGIRIDGLAHVTGLLRPEDKRSAAKAGKACDMVELQRLNSLPPYFEEPKSWDRRVFRNQVKKAPAKGKGAAIRTVRDLEQLYNIPDLSFYLKRYFDSLGDDIPAPEGDIDVFRGLELELFRKLVIPVERIDDGLDSHDVLATGTQIWYGQRRADWVWYMPFKDKIAEAMYGMFHGRLPARALAFFKIRWQGFSYRLAYIRKARPENSGQPHSICILPAVQYSGELAPEVNNIKTLMGRASLVWKGGSSDLWLVNNRIDHSTFTTIYPYSADSDAPNAPDAADS
jgi:hypothetical protein